MAGERSFGVPSKKGKGMIQHSLDELLLLPRQDQNISDSNLVDSAANKLPKPEKANNEIKIPEAENDKDTYDPWADLGYLPRH